MRYKPFIAAVLLGCATLTGACGGPAADIPSHVATAAPPTSPLATATATPIVFAAGSQVAGVDVGGLQPEAALAKVRAALAPLEQPLEVVVGTERMILQPQELGLRLPLEELLKQAVEQISGGAQVDVPLEISYDAEPLRSQLATLAAKVELPARVNLITATESFSRSFVYQPGRRLDLEPALDQLDELLRSPQEPRSITLDLSQGGPPAVDLDELQNQLEVMAERWRGVVGIYLYDLKSDQVVSLNEDSVFSGASVLKIPIMLQAYLSIPRFNADERVWLDEMIVDSNNLSSNALLSHIAGGTSTEDALEGVRKMNQTLEDLGLEHTFQNLPYESGDYLIKQRKLSIPKGPPEEGPPPYTEPDPYVRTTPAEISRLLLLIEECRQGEGVLLEKFGDTLTAERCGEMIARLERNADRSRILAGMPPKTRAAHKSGWVEDMQADVALVRSPGGDFVLAVYLYQKQNNSYLADERANPVIAAFARLVYSGYNPACSTQNEACGTQGQ